MQLTDGVKKIIALSRKVAAKLQNRYIQPAHILLGILQYEECLAYTILRILGTPIAALRTALEEANRESNDPSPLPRMMLEDSITLTTEVEDLLKLTQKYAKKLRREAVGTEHILLATLKTEHLAATRILNRFSITYESVEHVLTHQLARHYRIVQAVESDDSRASSSSESAMASRSVAIKRVEKPKTPILNSFSRDLTKLAEEGKLDPIVGRAKEIERVAQILSRRRKNNALLVGEPGVGKTAIAEGLALQIIRGRVAKTLLGKRVVTLDLTALVAGTKYRGQFEERLRGVMNELEKSTQIILFIDELHTLIGAGGASGTLDASNILKPALARGELQCMGATTFSEYRQHIEKDGALARRFQVVTVAPTTVAETIEILQNIKTIYEDHHAVIYTPEAIAACAQLAERYISNRLLPDKAIDVLDESGARVHMLNLRIPPSITQLEEAIESVRLEKNSVVRNQKYEEAAQLRDQERKLHEKLVLERGRWEEEIRAHKYPLSSDHVAEVITTMTGIPAHRIAHKHEAKLLTIKQELQAKVIGQDEAIDKLVKAIQRTYVGLQDPNRPLGTFIFLGPTGVGKTALAKALAELLFDRENALIRLDMSEYMEKFTASRLIGAPPGYIGYEEGGQLTEKIRNNPYSVVLLDEIEKAHPDVYNLLLQIMDDGILTDGLGRKIDCRHAIIIMTSNVGARDLQSTEIGFMTSTQKNDLDDIQKAKVHKALKQTFRPEFINRLDGVIVFNILTQAHIRQIIDAQLAQLANRAVQVGYKLEATRQAKDFLSKKGYDPQYGIRPLKRAIQQYIEDAITAQILSGAIQPGDTVRIGHRKGNAVLNLQVRQAKAKI
ncbi:MAG: ATP-dependent Clp protease ATP-binding subunit [Bacteroidota bacterium]